MKTLQVLLARNYVIDIEAKNQREVARCVELFVSHGSDASTEKEQKQYRFKIVQIDPRVNEAFEVHEVKDGSNLTL